MKQDNLDVIDGILDKLKHRFMSFLEHPVQIKKEEHSLTTSQKMLLYMWASYINHKIRLGKFSQVDYNHDLTIGQSDNI